MQIQPKLQALPKDITLYSILPLIKYFELEDFLESLNFSAEEIKIIKKQEYKKRAVLLTPDTVKEYYKKHKLVNQLERFPFTTAWYIDGECHNEDGIAMTFIKHNGDHIYIYTQRGKYHRIDDHAFEYIAGAGAQSRREWWLNGKLHRLDGPARVYYNGDVQWWVNGKRHREDGPAEERIKGTKKWYRNNKLHNPNGPAIIESTGYKAWYINGELHRLDGPAEECANGTKRWFINGKCHRDDGPAIIESNGDKSWFINGILHRDDGPAIILSEIPAKMLNLSIYKIWYKHGISYWPIICV